MKFDLQQASQEFATATAIWAAEHIGSMLLPPAVAPQLAAIAQDTIQTSPRLASSYERMLMAGGALAWESAKALAAAMQHDGPVYDDDTMEALLGGIRG